MVSADSPVEWLRPLIEARKAAAEAATPGPWTVKPVVYGPPEDGWGDPDVWEIEADGKKVVSHQTHEGGGIYSEADARHIADNDPRQIIADCEKDLAILDEHKHYPANSPDSAYWTADFGCGICHVHPHDGGTFGNGWCRTVRLLAWSYRHRDPEGYAEVAGDWTP